MRTIMLWGPSYSLSPNGPHTWMKFSLSFSWARNTSSFFLQLRRASLSFGPHWSFISYGPKDKLFYKEKKRKKGELVSSLSLGAVFLFILKGSWSDSWSAIKKALAGRSNNYHFLSRSPFLKRKNVNAKEETVKEKLSLSNPGVNRSLAGSQSMKRKLLDPALKRS